MKKRGRPKKQITYKTTSTPMTDHDEKALVVLYKQWIREWVQMQLQGERDNENRTTIPQTLHDAEAI